MSETKPSSHADSDDSSSDGEESHSEPELMITTRERRKTAGNRYSQVVAQEQAQEDEEDDVALLFAEMEEGEDEEYNSDEADDEADMSSSDDDDQGPNAAAADDMEGEQEIAKQAKAERSKKRKADMAMTTLSGIRKKPKTDPTTLHRAPDKAKPSKRKERQSWMPDENAAAGRSSMRKQTVAHRAVLYDQLKKAEEQRLKNKAIREQKEKQKQADAPKELTQADRLAEAEKIERRNAKSLNRWETLEKQRAEEQAAKLAALKGRKLNGPVLTFHSAVHVYRGPKVEAIESGSAPDGHVYKKRGPKPKVFPGYQPSPLATPIVPSSNFASPSPLIAPQVKYSTMVQAPIQPTTKEPGPKPVNSDWLAGIHEYASIPSASGTATPLDANSVAVTPDQTDDKQILAENLPLNPIVPERGTTHPSVAITNPAPVAPASNVSQAGQPLRYLPSVLPIPVYRPAQTIADKQTQDVPNQTSEPRTDVNFTPTQATVPPATPSMLPQPPALTHVLDFTSSNAPSPSPAPASVSTPPLIEVTSMRNLVILQDFEDLAADARQAFNVFYGTKKPPKPTKHVTELCTITGLPAKYRDPATGASYANNAAYKKLQQLRNHGYTWSSMLGCYVGKAGVAARGVPEGFLVS